jgi:hypothetical protein
MDQKLESKTQNYNFYNKREGNLDNLGFGDEFL